MVDPHPGSLDTIRGAAWLPGYTPALASPRYSCMQTIDAYAAGVKYGMEEFKERVYKGHHQVVDKSKW